jgi:hypothetical protein
MNKKGIAYFELSLMIIATFAFSYFLYASTEVSAATTMSEPSSCCEKTDGGAYCINTKEANCNDAYRSSPTSCETTSYCKLGTCYDSQEGICMENTPQVVCDENGGTWDSRPMAEVPQCQLGCCIIADQAAFVPLVRCKRLSTLFGVENNYRTDIGSETDCIATAQAQDSGACVYEKDFERICEFTTRGECGADNVVEQVNGTNVTLSSEKKFYKDYLCSAEELNTACARQTSTTCYEGKVYWVDSCGNKENVYSADKEKSWNNGKVAEPEEVCAPNDGTDKNCGNCEYLLGARCAEWEGIVGGPSDSDYYCQKNECVDRKGDKRINGESWCVYDGEVGEGKDLVGSRYYREVCIDGEVRVEPCGDFRSEICLDGSIDTDLGDFETSGCRVNRWQDCVLQKDEDDCTNIDRRDCMWMDPVTGMMIGGGSDSESKTFSNPSTSGTFSNPSATGNVIAPITGNALFGGSDDEEEEEKTTTNRPKGICVPNYPPGFNFWDDAETQGICGQANAKCIVTFEKNLLGSEKCVENCECLEEGWALDANRVCAALGDCGGYVNIAGKYTDDGYLWKEDGDEKQFAPNNVNRITAGFTGFAITAFNPHNVLGLTGLVIGGEKVVIDGVTYIKEGGAAATTATNTPVASGGLAKVTGVAAKTSTLTTSSTLQTTQGGVLVQKGTVITLDAQGGGTFVANGQTYSMTAAEVQAAQGSGQIGVPYTGGQATLAEWLKLTPGGGPSALVSGLQWAGIAYMAGMLIGNLFGMSKKNTQALSTALAGGAFVYEALSTYNFNAPGAMFGPNSMLASVNPLLAGVAVGAIIFILMYKKVETVVVTFDCKAWQAPSGGNDCELCNDQNLPCSEYRCKSLGQNCEIVNEGTDREQCVNVNPKDVNPPIIKPDYETITSGHEYTNVKNSPPGPGFQVIRSNSSDGCLAAFTPLEFGILTDEPAQCKIDFNHTTTIEDMSNYFGGTNMYLYNHTEKFSLPGAQAFKNSSFVLENGNQFTFFVRCQDKNGNENEAEYAVRFCVDDGPDVTAPEVRATSVLNGGCVAENSDSAVVDFYTNEPADCKWSTTDQSYDNMQNTMACSNRMYQVNAMQLFTCRANLTGISKDSTNFYVRCKDQPEATADRNENKQSFVFSTRGSTALKIKTIQPNGTVFGAVSPAPVELYVETLFGCEEGKAVCFYSKTGNEDDYIMFYDTDTTDGIHTQRQDLTAGKHKYWIKCVDSGGNVAIDTLEFTLDIDTSAPVVARVYEEESMLKIVTVRDSECSYSLDNCDFTFAEGIEMPYANSTTHVAEWNKDKTYYIKCRDEFRNEGADCSIVVRPSQNFF